MNVEDAPRDPSSGGTATAPVATVPGAVPGTPPTPTPPPGGDPATGPATDAPELLADAQTPRAPVPRNPPAPAPSPAVAPVPTSPLDTVPDVAPGTPAAPVTPPAPAAPATVTTPAPPAASPASPAAVPQVTVPDAVVPPVTIDEPATATPGTALGTPLEATPDVPELVDDEGDAPEAPLDPAVPLDTDAPLDPAATPDADATLDTDAVPDPDAPLADADSPLAPAAAPAATAAPAPLPLRGASEAETATFAGEPWRERAALAANVLQGAWIDTIDRRVLGAVDAVTTAATETAEAASPSTETSGTCPGGGSLTSRRARSADVQDPTMTVENVEHEFADCSVNGSTLDGTWSARDISERAAGVPRRREYAIVVTAADGARARVRGDVRRESGDDATACEAAGTTADVATFDGSLYVEDEALGIVVEELASEREATVEVAGTEPCTGSRTLAWEERALFTVPETDEVLEVRRAGTRRDALGAAGGTEAAAGDTIDASFELRTLGDATARLRIESTAAPGTALVTIDDGDARASFEAPWEFAYAP